MWIGIHKKVNRMVTLEDWVIKTEKLFDKTYFNKARYYIYVSLCTEGTSWIIKQLHMSVKAYYTSRDANCTNKIEALFNILNFIFGNKCISPYSLCKQKGQEQVLSHVSIFTKFDSTL